MTNDDKVREELQQIHDDYFNTNMGLQNALICAYEQGRQSIKDEIMSKLGLSAREIIKDLK